MSKTRLFKIGIRGRDDRATLRVGALLVEANGVGFKLGTGLTDDEREHPPRIGAEVTFRYTEWPKGGKPRHPRFLRVREET